MAQTFDIRFARSAGLAGLFEAPMNEFRWKGAGRLSIDASGINIAAQRGLLTLFARAQSRRIAANSLLEVYREGNALRLEFSTRESSRNVLPFWASDRSAAAEIVTLLPTQRSVELEETGSARRYRFDQRIVSILACVVVLGAGALTLLWYLAGDRAAPAVATFANPVVQVRAPDSLIAPATSVAPTEGETRPLVGSASPGSASDISIPLYLDPPELPASSMDETAVTAAPAAVPEETPSRMADTNSRVPLATASPEGIVPIVPGDPRYTVARRQLDLFLAERDALRAEYDRWGDYPSAEGLQDLEARWRNVTSRIYNADEFGGWGFLALRELELAVSRSWQGYLSIHASGIRTANKTFIDAARIQFAFTEALEALLPQFVR